MTGRYFRSRPGVAIQLRCANDRHLFEQAADRMTGQDQVHPAVVKLARS